MSGGFEWLGTSQKAAYSSYTDRLCPSYEDLVDWDVHELDQVAKATHDRKASSDSAADLDVLW